MDFLSSFLAPACRHRRPRRAHLEAPRKIITRGKEHFVIKLSIVYKLCQALSVMCTHIWRVLA